MAQLPPKGKYAADLVGQTIEGKYALKAVLGRGGMGTVYEALHRLTNRRVAVKVLLPEHAEKPESIARFHQEARVVSSIGHSNICEILDFGRLADGRPFLVMELLEGETLGTLLERKGRLPVGEAVAVVVQALEALDAAHAKGIIHRDMKPDNVFLTARGGGAPVVKVLDFGISKAFGEDRDVELTRTGMVMGTPYYMAPEQARGDRSLDPRVDVWASGVILYEAISGRRPFLAKNYNALLVEILTAAHRPLSSLVPGVPGGLEAVIDRALSKRREDRQPTVAALASALAAYAGALPRKSGGPPRARTDRFVEVGGERIPVTWEDTGGDTPGSGAGAVIHASSLRAAIGAVAPGQAWVPSPALPGAAAVAATGRPPIVEDEDTTKIIPGESTSTDELTPRLRRPVAIQVPPAPPREEGRTRYAFIAPSEGATRVAASPSARAGLRGGVTPPVREEAPRVTPPAPEPRPAPGPASQPPVDDIETTIVDSEPPSFATDLYVAAKDRKEKR